MKFHKAIIFLLLISASAFGQTIDIPVQTLNPKIEIPSKKGVEIGVESFIEPISTESNFIFLNPALDIQYEGDYVPMKMVHTYKGQPIHPDIIGIKERESIGYMFLCREPAYKQFYIYVNEKNPDFGFYSIGPDIVIYPCEIRNVVDGVSIIYHQSGRFLIEWKEGVIFDGTNTYKL